MLQFFLNNWGTMLVGIVLITVLVLIVIKLYRNKKKGKTACGCGCEHCPSSDICHRK